MAMNFTPDMGINRPLKAWDYELSDPSWRRWFDMLLGREQAQGADPFAQALTSLRGQGGVEIAPSFQFQQGLSQPLMQTNEAGEEVRVPGMSTREYSLNQPMNYAEADDLYYQPNAEKNQLQQGPAMRGLKRGFKKGY